MLVAKWGNSLAIRLPADLVRKLGIQVGDEIDLQASEHGLTVIPQPTPDEVLRELKGFQGRLKADDQLGRDRAHER